MFSKEGKAKDVATPRICDVVWHDGNFIDWNDARVHVMSHVLHYGSSIFEGIRCYATNDGPAIFRLKEHMQRFLNSAKIYRMDHEWTLDQLCDASVELVDRSGLEQCYIRPILFRSLDEAKPAFGVNPFPNPLACYIGAWDWGKYLGDEAIEKGVDVCVSTWNRLTPNSMPAMAKSGANYMNSQLIKMEALLNGFAEGIALDDRGYVSEGSGENIFMVSGGVVLTPPLSSSILPGITRDSVIQICHELGITVKERSIQRAALYVADELSSPAPLPRSLRSVPSTGSRSAPAVVARSPRRFRRHSSKSLKVNGRRPGDWLTYVNSGASRDAGIMVTSTRARSEAPRRPTQPSRAVLKYQAAANDD